MDSSSSPLEKLTLWIYENKKLFNSSQYIEVMQLVSDAYKQNNNDDDSKLIDAFDYARFRLNSENENENVDDDENWSGTDDIVNSSSDESENESTYVGSYINHY